MAQVRIQFGGESTTLNLVHSSELTEGRVAGLLGYDPARVEFSVNGSPLAGLRSFNNGDVVSVRTKANTKGAAPVPVTVVFGGERSRLHIASVADLSDARNSGLLGYDPARAEFIRNGQVLQPGASLYAEDVINVRTKANTKGSKRSKASRSR